MNFWTRHRLFAKAGGVLCGVARKHDNVRVCRDVAQAQKNVADQAVGLWSVLDVRVAVKDLL